MKQAKRAMWGYACLFVWNAWAVGAMLQASIRTGSPWFLVMGLINLTCAFLCHGYFEFYLKRVKEMQE